MKHRLTAILLAGLMPAGMLHGADAKEDLNKLQGTWDVTAINLDGNFIAAKDLPGNVTIIFTGDKMVLDWALEAAKREKPVKTEFTVRLGPSKKPKVIDMTALNGELKGKTQLGIYQLEDDDLTLCLPNQEAVRPTEFKSPKGSQVIVMTMKRSRK